MTSIFNLLRFMCRLHEQLQYFVTMKISTDSLWQNVTVILSGHETPGEGEHKIMDIIRHGKQSGVHLIHFKSVSTSCNVKVINFSQIKA